MSKNVLITGANGYIGNAITQRLLNKGYKVVGIDSNVKLNWLAEMYSSSAIDVLPWLKKVNKLQSIYPNYIFYNIDIAKQIQNLKFIFEQYKFDTVINLAQNPSAPYSMKSLENASWTIENNYKGCLNILWMMKEYCPNAHLIEIESMGTFQPDIGTDIPEGKFQFEYNGRKSKPSIFPKCPASFYHSSKVLNTYLADCANRWWGIKSTIINQGVVYGNYTPEIEESKIHSHLTVDEALGTVINRFIVQAMLDHDLTIYGKGDHSRGFLSLNDSIQCLELFTDNPPNNKEIRIVNQLDEDFTMNELAEKIIKVSKEHLNKDINKTYIESPRNENTEKFYYNPSFDTLKNLGFKQTRTIEDEAKFSFDHINKKTLTNLKKLVIPKITWR